MSDELPIWLNIPDDLPDDVVEKLQSLSGSAQLLYVALRWQAALTGSNLIAETEVDTLVERFLAVDKGHAFHRHEPPIEERGN